MKHQHFYSFVWSVELLLGQESGATLKRLKSHFVAKWRQPYYCTSSYVKSRVAITMVRATHR